MEGLYKKHHLTYRPEPVIVLALCGYASSYSVRIVIE
jgi:hypothetical protein